MSKSLTKAVPTLIAVAIVGAGATFAIASGTGDTDGPSAAQVQYEQPPGDQGCTPGFWKNNTNVWSGYSASDSFNAVFGVSHTPSLTLLQAAELEGGGFNALLRHAAAALLNSSQPLVNYGMTTSQLITAVQGAFASGEPEALKDDLDTLNNAGCSVDAHGNPIDD